MHDIGKIGVPDFIIKKTGKLTNSEWAVMKQHPKFGYEILDGSKSELMQCARDIAYCHHEKWDGSGYPRGLVGEDIPLSARIVAIADVYDALRSDRPYKTAWSHKESLEFIKNKAGSFFDPYLVDSFIKRQVEIESISVELADDD